jgi:hypothetical protein
MAQVCCIGVGSCPILGADGKSRQGRFLFLYPFLVLFDYKDTIKREKSKKYFDFSKRKYLRPPGHGYAGIFGLKSHS